MELERSDPRGGQSSLEVKEGGAGDRIWLSLSNPHSTEGTVSIQLSAEDVDNLTIMLQYYKQEILTEKG